MTYTDAMIAYKSLSIDYTDAMMVYKLVSVIGTRVSKRPSKIKSVKIRFIRVPITRNMSNYRKNININPLAEEAHVFFN